MAAALNDEELNKIREILGWAPGAQTQLQEVERRTQQTAVMNQEVGKLKGRLDTLVTERGAFGRQLEGLQQQHQQEQQQVREVLTSLEAKMAVASAEHEDLHKTVERLEGMYTELKDQGWDKGAGQKAKGVDLRQFLPDKLNCKVGEPQEWRDWSHRSKTYLSKAIDRTMRNVLDRVEKSKDPIGAGQLTLYGITQAMDDDLRDFLDLRTEGESFRMVKSGSKLPAIEIWRLLHESADPETDRGTFLDMGELLQIKRGTDLSNIRGRIIHWEEQVEMYQSKSGELIPKDLWRQSLLAMLPQAVADELNLIMDKFPTYLALRTKVLQIAAERSRRNVSHRGLFNV